MVNMKKNLLYVMLMAAYFFGGVGCKKYLSKDIQGVYPADEFYQTSGEAVLAINAAYRPLTFTSATTNPLWVFGDIVASD